MWEVNLYGKGYYGYTTLGRLSTQQPGNNNLPFREKIALSHGFYTKPEECSHTFFYMYNNEELKIQFVYHGMCENIITEEKKRTVRLYGRRDSKIHKFLLSDEKLQKIVWKFMWAMYKHLPPES